VSADTPNDSDLDELSAETAALRQHYRAASQEEPSVALDEAIRAAARREVKAHPLTIGSGFKGSWRVPASIAAVVVVSVTVALMVVQRDPRSLATREQPASGLPAAVGVAKDQAQPASGDRAAKEQVKVEAAKATPQVRPPAAPPMPSSSAPIETHTERSDLAAKKMESHSPMARAAVEQDEPPRMQVPSEPALPAGAETPTRVTAARAAAPPPAPEGAAKATADGIMSGQSLNKERAPSNVAHQAELKASPWEKDPQTWLAHIEELRAAGRLQDAQASFRAFRGRYPDYSLPSGFVPPVPPDSN
jgi:hypothetical protein